MSGRLAILISGGGTTAKAVIDACQSRRLDLEPAVVISSKIEAGGIEKAERLGVVTEVVRSRDYGKSGEEFGKGLLSVLEKYKVEWVAQCGWLAKTPKEVVFRYEGRIVNQHPGALDEKRPDFGGPGMYGARVTATGLIYAWVTGVKKPWTAATVHRVTCEYDEGEVIKETVMDLPVWDEDDEPVIIKKLGKEYRSLLMDMTKACQERLLPIEHINVIEALGMMLRGEDGMGRRTVPLIPEANWGVLEEAKELAIDLFSKG